MAGSSQAGSSPRAINVNRSCGSSPAGTSPLFARKSYWCIIRTLEAAGFVVRPYHAAVPSFGVWGFALARRTKFELPTSISAGLKFITSESLPAMFVLPADMAPLPVEINRLDNQVLVRYHDIDWRRWD